MPGSSDGDDRRAKGMTSAPIPATSTSMKRVERVDPVFDAPGRRQPPIA